MAGFIGLATGLGRIGAGLGRARREAMDANQRDAERQAAIEREVQQQAFQNWMQRAQLENAAKDREAARAWQEKAFSAGQEERAAARADQAAYREAQMQESARLQRERLDAQREQAAQQDQTRRMIAAMANARSSQGAQTPPTPRVTEGERKAAALLNLANDAFGSLDRYQPSVRAQQASKIPVVGNILAGKLDEEGQAAQQAGFQFADAYMRFISGAAVPESEVRRYMGTFMPQPGDSPATVARKKSARNAIMQSLRIGAGRAVDPNATPTEPSGYSPDNPDPSVMGQTPKGRPPIESLLRSR